MSEPWNKALTEKLRYFLMIKPFIDLRNIRSSDEKVNQIYSSYDPLAIALKIVEIIINNSSILTGDNRQGLSKIDIIDNISPYLKLVDKKLDVTSSDDIHEQFISKILSGLLSRSRTVHKIAYTDYSISPPMEKSVDFNLLVTRAHQDTGVQYYASEEAINIFGNILDMGIEDRQRAILYVLNRQIERGDLENAVQSAENNLLATLQYESSINKLIGQIRRDYNIVKWGTIKKELLSAQKHIDEYIEEHNRQGRQIRIRYQNVDETTPTQYNWFQRLKDKIKASYNSLFILQGNLSNMLSELKETQIHAILEQDNKRELLQLEKDLFLNILSMNENNPLTKMENANHYFQAPKINNIVTLDDTMNLLFKKSVAKEQKNRRKRLSDRAVAVEILDKFSEELKKETVNIILSMIKLQPQKLSNILFELEKIKTNMAEYACVFLVARSTDINFEKNICDTHLEMEWITGDLNTEYYKGDNMIVRSVI